MNACFWTLRGVYEHRTSGTNDCVGWCPATGGGRDAIDARSPALGTSSGYQKSYDSRRRDNDDDAPLWSVECYCGEMRTWLVTLLEELGRARQVNIRVMKALSEMVPVESRAGWRIREPGELDTTLEIYRGALEVDPVRAGKLLDELNRNDAVVCGLSRLLSEEAQRATDDDAGLVGTDVEEGGG